MDAQFSSLNKFISLGIIVVFIVLRVGGNSSENLFNNILFISGE